MPRRDCLLKRNDGPSRWRLIGHDEEVRLQAVPNQTYPVAPCAKSRNGEQLHLGARAVDLAGVRYDRSVHLQGGSYESAAPQSQRCRLPLQLGAEDGGASRIAALQI